MPRVDDFLQALALAREKLSTRDPEEICRLAGAEWAAAAQGGQIRLPFYTKQVAVTFPAGEVAYAGEAGTLSLQEQGLILHYLLGVEDRPLAGELITFREIPSGEFYYQPFLNRALVPLVKTFGTDHASFLRAGAPLGGRTHALGDVALTFSPFPMTPLTLILWKGDEEFPPEGTILFDRTIKYFLSGEDIAFLAGSVVYKLMALSRS